MNDERTDGTRANRVAFVTVGWFWNPMTAWIVRNRLADEGIEAFVVDEYVALRHLLLLMFIVAFVLGLLNLTGHTWYEAASDPGATLW